MKGIILELIEESVRNYAQSAIGYLYKEASVGSNPLELGKHSVSYDSEGTTYHVTAIDIDFNEDAQGVLKLQQQEEGYEHFEWYEIANLGTYELIELMKACEAVTECEYDGEFYNPHLVTDTGHKNG